MGSLTPKSAKVFCSKASVPLLVMSGVASSSVATGTMLPSRTTPAENSGVEAVVSEGVDVVSGVGAAAPVFVEVTICLVSEPCSARGAADRAIFVGGSVALP